MSGIIQQRHRIAARRRAFLGLAAASLAFPLGGMAPGSMRESRSLRDTLDQQPICRTAADAYAIAPGASPREIKMMWNSNAICTAGVPVAEQLGLFAKRNIKIEKVNIAATADQILEALATGKADAGYGMAWIWLKPLEQGFDVKLTAGVHGGCIRLLTAPGSGITSIAGLKGKTVGTFNMGSPDRIFMSVLASKRGIDPVKDIEWRVYPPDLLGVALQKGEIQAFSTNDPIASILRDRDHLVEVTNNLSDEYDDRTCCVLGIRGSLVRDERPVAAAITAALMEAQEWVAENPEGAAEIFAGVSKVGSKEQLAAMLRTHTHHHHPVNVALTREVTLFAEELKQASVLRRSTDPAELAARVCVDVLTT
ncbi:MAG TPA: ABC transporter substrate-binding protein [Acetobacteraceae bacterium]|nr:ABC transporter substrate-binding protein [Acetobacteraceae bacterium]